MKTKAIFRWKPGRFARSSSALFAWMVLRAGAQAATILLLARTLGAVEYGRYVTVLAVASFLVPFVGLGLAGVLLRNGAKDPAHIDHYLARAMHGWWVSLPFCLAAAWLLAEWMLPTGTPRTAVCAAIAAELVATSLTELRARHLQAQHRIAGYGSINAGLVLCRLAVIAAYVLLVDRIDAEQLLWVYASASILFAAAILLSIRTGSRKLETREPMNLFTGMPFSMAAFSMRLQTELNKPLLAHIGFDLAGTYNAGQRANELASMPLSALQEALWPKLYSQADPRRQLMVTGAALVSLAASLGIIIWLLAPLVPRILGADFAPAAEVMRGLAALPTLQAFRGLANFHAIHQGRMPLIGWTYTVGAACSVVTLALLVPNQGLMGAVISAYVTETIMIAILVAGSKYPDKNDGDQHRT